MERLSTGIDALDRRLGGGLPAGSLLLFSSAPASQAELVLAELIADRPTTYLTPFRPAEAVRAGLDSSALPPTAVDVVELDPADPIPRARGCVDSLPAETTLVVDPVDPLERRAEDYRELLVDLQATIADTDRIAVLHALSGRSVPPQRDLSEHIADIVFELRTEVVGTEITNRLVVPKFRGGRALEETIKLKLADDVTIDTSRDIA
ncbi:RAD55 family ATPase [Haloferacaceae archaeon DSL9]